MEAQSLGEGRAEEGPRGRKLGAQTRGRGARVSHAACGRTNEARRQTTMDRAAQTAHLQLVTATAAMARARKGGNVPLLVSRTK
jgi:hypothetical protein